MVFCMASGTMMVDCFPIKPARLRRSNLNRTSCGPLNRLLDSQCDIEVIHSQDIWDRVRMVGMEAVDSEADIDVFIHLHPLH